MTRNYILNEDDLIDFHPALAYKFCNSDKLEHKHTWYYVILYFCTKYVRNMYVLMRLFVDPGSIIASGQMLVCISKWLRRRLRCTGVVVTHLNINFLVDKLVMGRTGIRGTATKRSIM